MTSIGHLVAKEASIDKQLSFLGCAYLYEAVVDQACR
jgi:hypothetical protein